MTPLPTGLVVEQSPLSSFLALQQRLETPAAAFARLHESAALTTSRHRDLIPLSAPGEGEQYAFEVDLDQCTGCKACVAACHSLNGLDDEETWRDVGLLIGGSVAEPYQQTITTACHHCEDPECLNGCPVLAYEKDPLTGIVRHLDDQCIGCQYCVLKCPYDVPKFSPSKGIVRKCDMCHSRLAVGEAPACAQACPTEAIRITVVPQSNTAEPYENPDFLNAFPDASITRPTTRYRTSKPIPDNAVAADAEVLRPQHAHWPLVWMLTLTQAGWGLFVAALALPEPAVAHTLAAVLLFTGLNASLAHLGRPLGAWRAFLGLRRSWLSREIVVFGLVAPLAAGVTLAGWWMPLAPWAALLGWGNVLLGGLGVFASVMIYHDTHRQRWHFPHTASAFYGTAVSFGLAAGGVFGGSPWMLMAAAGFVLIRRIAHLAWCHRQQSHPSRAIRQAALILRGPLARSARLSTTFAVLGSTLLLASLAFSGSAQLVLGLAGCVGLLGHEILERAHFFQTVDAPKMPGGLAR